MWTDGACQPNPGHGGWAAILKFEKHTQEIYGYQANTTNNQMELTAAVEGLLVLQEPCFVTLFSDSQYLVKTMTCGWKRNKNHDLWYHIDELCSIHSVDWRWVRGHSSNVMNNRCDRLASLARKGGRSV
jgi:ribonuclease HI